MANILTLLYNRFFSKYTSIIFIVFLVILFSYIGYNGYKKYYKNKADVKDFSDVANANTRKKEAQVLFFFADWCPHCKKAKPEWEQFKEEYDGKTINGYVVIFEEYNCTDENSDIEDLINKYKIEGYPTIKLIKDNQVVEYDAKPTKATMEQFLTTVL